MFLECSLFGNELHSHTYYANTRLFKKFIAKFIEKTVQLESNSKDDFIEKWGKIKRMNSEELLKLIKHGSHAPWEIPKEFLKDRQFTLKFVKIEGGFLQYVDENFKKDRAIVLEAVKNYRLYSDDYDDVALKFADKLFRKDKEIILEALNASGINSLKYIDESLKNDREFILEAVKIFGIVLKIADESLKKDKEIVLEAIKESYIAIKFADDNLKKDKEIVIEAVKRNVGALEYADHSLKKDKEVILEAVKKVDSDKGYANKSAKKTEFDFILNQSHESLRNDSDILRIVNKNGN